jgi:hypothetical protein
LGIGLGGMLGGAREGGSGRGVCRAAAHEWRKAFQAGPIAANIAVEAENRHAGRPGVVVMPVQLLLPAERPQSSELLIYVDAPVSRQQKLPQSSVTRDEAGALAVEVERALRQNVFGLRQSVFEEFLTDLEQVLREDLEDDWVARPGWKQTAEDFELSRFAAESGAQLNHLNPGRLIALREHLDAYLEARRRWSLRQLEVEITGALLKAPWRRGAVWLESLLVFPIACYGLLNHLLSGLFLFWTGLLKSESGRDRRVEWIARGLVVLGCYTVQILVCAHWLGRRAAGLYAPTLPLSGAALWRASWLFRHRTRLALFAALRPRSAANLRRTRKEVLRKLETVVQAYADTLDVAH